MYGLERNITQKGIQVYGLLYVDVRSTELRICGKEKVNVRTNTNDSGFIEIYDIDQQEYIQISSLVREYASGLTLRQHNGKKKTTKDVVKCHSSKLSNVAIKLKMNAVKGGQNGSKQT